MNSRFACSQGTRLKLRIDARGAIARGALSSEACLIGEPLWDSGDDTRKTVRNRGDSLRIRSAISKTDENVRDQGTIVLEINSTRNARNGPLGAYAIDERYAVACIQCTRVNRVIYSESICIIGKRLSTPLEVRARATKGSTVRENATTSYEETYEFDSRSLVINR